MDKQNIWGKEKISNNADVLSDDDKIKFIEVLLIVGTIMSAFSQKVEILWILMVFIFTAIVYFIFVKIKSIEVKYFNANASLVASSFSGVFSYLLGISICTVTKRLYPYNMIIPIVYFIAVWWLLTKVLSRKVERVRWWNKMDRKKIIFWLFVILTILGVASLSYGLWNLFHGLDLIIKNGEVLEGRDHISIGLGLISIGIALISVFISQLSYLISKDSDRKLRTLGQGEIKKGLSKLLEVKEELSNSLFVLRPDVDRNINDKTRNEFRFKLKYDIEWATWKNLSYTKHLLVYEIYMTEDDKNTLLGYQKNLMEEILQENIFPLLINKHVQHLIFACKALYESLKDIGNYQKIYERYLADLGFKREKRETFDNYLKRCNEILNKIGLDKQFNPKLIIDTADYLKKKGKGK